MSTSNQKLPEIKAKDLPSAVVPAEFLLSLATGPMLLGLLSGQAIFSWLQATGIASEELFRGYSLPVLHFPEVVKDD
ncbi:MAG: hypothetical protein F6K36_20220 [Symploca sp. SIO3C6]|uniref:Uncharacterized protein n=1 Tax=Symploca sp. SIO1C4 TaxID=2607765 RepID=A0A6B3NDS7_9CYAN|nr:hypothetical protein [Symploca sp. SIO3C6]NER29737.1 hypothetical protein [Symploca sp. SIO1C4]NET06735.1 hypothetical protein [Symploca sp. SIO2B6]